MSSPKPISGQRRGRTLLVLAALLAAGAAVVHFLLPRSAPPPVVRVYTPAQVQVAQQHINALRDQLMHPADAAPSPVPAATPSDSRPARTRKTARPAPPPRLVRLQLSEADLNTYLASNPDARRMLQSHGVRAVQILLRAPHNIDIRAAVLYHGSPANIDVQGLLAVSPDTLCRFTATRAQVGRLPIPPGTVTAQADRIASLFAGRYRGRLPLTVQDVQVVGDSLVLLGTPRQTETH